MRLNRAVLWVGLASFLSLIATVLLVDVTRDWSRPTPIAGDPTSYAGIADAILSGGSPYIDVTVEHLPLMLVPILAVGVLADLTGVDYRALWPFVSIGAVLGSVVLAGRIRIVPEYQRRYAVAVVPMLPLIIYRLEVFVVLAALAAIAAFGVGRLRAGAWWSVAGTLAKGWPITLLGVPLRRGAARLATVAAAASVGVLAVVPVLPGFREGRAFSGIHSETVVGNVLLLVRHAAGTDLQIMDAAGATYVGAPGPAIAVNAALGVVVAAVAVVALLRTSDLAALVRICGLATIGIMLMSPLLSAQFVFWLVPFVALLSLGNRRIFVAAGFLSTLLVAFWDPFAVWWAIEVAVRNLLIVVLAVRWAGDVIEAVSPSPSPAEHLA